MRIYLAVLMVLIVSGETIIQGNVGGSVLLPCNCSDRNLDKDFQWQKQTPNDTMVFKQHGNTSSFYDRYERRAEIFLSENSENCSLLLRNITADDKGIYKCIFYRQELYKPHAVKLNVSAIYNVCQTRDNRSGSVNVFHCDVEGRYRDAEIQWKLDGRLLTNSTETHITHTFNLDAPPGFYLFHSNLTTKLNWTSEPTCDVILKAKDISAIVHRGCSPRTGETTIQGNVGGSVLLPCNCSDRDLDEDFWWQKQKPDETLVFNQHGNTSSFYGRYERRAEIFLSEKSENCSLLLRKITADDKGIYKCRFLRQDVIKPHEVELKVSAIYNVCQTRDNRSGSVNVFHCDVEGRYRNAEIQWKLDGKLLMNSTETHITHTFNLVAPPGFYFFHSNLTTKLSWTSEPSCDVILKAKDISANVHRDCSPRTGLHQRVQEIPQPIRHHCYTIIPIVLVLGLSLILQLYRQVRRGRKKWRPTTLTAEHN